MKYSRHIMAKKSSMMTFLYLRYSVFVSDSAHKICNVEY